MNLLNANSHSFFNISGSKFLPKTNNILSIVLQVHHVLSIIAWVDDLGASTNHKGGVLTHKTLVSLWVPLGWLGKTSVTFLDALDLSNFLVKLLHFSLNFLERFIVRALPISENKFDVLC